MRNGRRLICLLLICAMTSLPIVIAQEGADGLAAKAADSYRKKEYERSAQLYGAAIKQGAQDTDIFYNAACSFALADLKDEAFEYLAQAIKRGFANADHLKVDPDLTGLHADIRWQPLVEKSVANYQASTIFSFAVFSTPALSLAHKSRQALERPMIMCNG